MSEQNNVVNIATIINRSGINPTEYKVLVLPDSIEEKIGSVYIPDKAKEQEQFAQTKGRIVAASPLAFSYADEEEWLAASAEKPKVGDTVLYAKYAGFEIEGKDGVKYYMIVDKDICATIEG